MAIFNKPLVMTRDLNSAIRYDTLVVPSTTAKILASRAINVIGAAGLGISVAEQLALADGGVYSGFDPMIGRVVNDKVAKGFSDWINFYAVSGLANTDLIKNRGRTISQLITDGRDIASMDMDDQIALVSLEWDADVKASGKIQADFSNALWGRKVSSARNAEGSEAEIESLNDLFNEKGSWHGLAPDDLGEWNDEHPWGNGDAPNTLTGAAHKQINIPQIFGASSNRNIDLDIIREAVISTEMIRGTNTVTLAPCASNIYTQIVSEFNSVDNDEVLIMVDAWELSIRAIHFYGVLFYVDDYAPKDRIRGIHVGGRNTAMTRGVQNAQVSTDAGFQVVFWNDAGGMQEAQAQLARETPPGREVPMNLVGIENPRSPMLPFFFTDWVQDTSLVNAATRNVELMVNFYGPCRYKHFEIRDLNEDKV